MTTLFIILIVLAIGGGLAVSMAALTIQSVNLQQINEYSTPPIV